MCLLIPYSYSYSYYSGERYYYYDDDDDYYYYYYCYDYLIHTSPASSWTFGAIVEPFKPLASTDVSLREPLISSKCQLD